MRTPVTSAAVLCAFLLPMGTARSANPIPSKAQPTPSEASELDDLEVIKQLAARLGDPRRNRVHFRGGSDPVYLKLVTYGKLAVPTLRDVYRQGNRAAKKEALYALGHMNDPDLCDFFLKAADDQDRELRRIAHWALIYLKQRKLIPFFLATLKDKSDPTVRGCAALALGKFQDKSLIEPLCEALQIKDSARREAALALQQIGSKQAVPELIRAYEDDPSFMPVPVVVQVVGELDAGSNLEFFRACLRNKNPAVVREALEVLVRQVDKSAIPLIHGLIDAESPHPHVVAHAGAALYRLGDRAGLDVLLAGLKRKDMSRNNFAYELTQLQDPTATRHLVEALSFEDSDRENFKYGILLRLGDTGDKSVLKVLVAVLGENRSDNYAAIQSIEKLTGVKFDYPCVADDLEHQQGLQRVRNWWQEYQPQAEQTL